MHVIEKKRSNVLCYIGGTGPLKYKLQKQIEKLNLVNKVKLIGFVSDESLPLWMNACDVFILPSLSESFGVVQIEAMACGKPVVATRNGGSEEIITSEEYGLLCSPANSKDLADKTLVALDKIWDNKNIETYMQKFRWEQIVEDIVKIYRLLDLEE